MFYCEPCRLVNDWPHSIMRWRSVCEVCSKFSDDCNDIQSAALTPVKPTLEWLAARSDALLVEIWFRAGRINHEDRQYWLDLLTKLRASRPSQAEPQLHDEGNNNVG